MAKDETIAKASGSEKAIISSLLDNPKLWPEVLDRLKPTDFLTPKYQTIFAVMCDAWNNGIELDHTMLGTELMSRNLSEPVGVSTLMEFIGGASTLNWQYHANVIRETSARWKLEQAGVQITQLARSGESPEEVIAFAEDQLRSAQGGETESVVSIDDSLTATLTDLRTSDNRPTISTGFTEMDELMNGGLRPGQMVIMAARPGVGKTTLSVDIMREACIRNGHTALFFSLEMSKEELSTRVIAAETETRFSDLVENRLGEPEWEELEGKLEDVRKAKIFIDDSPGMTMLDIRARVRQMKAKHGLDLVVIDYLQLLTSGRRVESRQQEVSEFSRQIKLLAKECEVPIIAVAQLNRDSEKRGEDALPKMSDLRESGSLEQDADMVLLIHRPDAQDPNHARMAEVDFILAKNRAGQIGTVTAASQLHYARFVDPPRGAGMALATPENEGIGQWNPTGTTFQGF